MLPAASLLNAAHRPAFREIADGVDFWLVLEVLLSSPVDTQLGAANPGAGLSEVSLLGFVTLVAALPVAWLSAAFLSGGVLIIYADSPNPLSWRRFLWGCWRWFGAFLLLGIVQGAVWLGGFLPLVILGAALIANVGGWLAWVIIPSGVLVGVAWLALVEYCGAFMILKQTRNVFRALGEAIRYAAHHPLALAGLYGITLGLLGLVNVLYHFGVFPLLPLTGWPLVFIAWQTFLAARLFLRLARWAGSVSMIAQI